MEPCINRKVVRDDNCCNEIECDRQVLQCERVSVIKSMPPSYDERQRSNTYRLPRTRTRRRRKEAEKFNDFLLHDNNGTRKHEKRLPSQAFPLFCLTQHRRNKEAFFIEGHISYEAIMRAKDFCPLSIPFLYSFFVHLISSRCASHGKSHFMGRI